MSENITTEIAINVISAKPAEINFNYQEISGHLDSVLAKYAGLVFTESDATECKKTIAELRKGQKSLDEFRKNTKKQLTESVTAFENKCKTLHGKFDTVIQPLTEQQEKFEADRREKKRAEIQNIIDGLVLEQKLSIKYASEMSIPEEYFNKGKSIKSIKTELSALANSLKIKQDKETQDMDLIITKVRLANAQYQLTNTLISNPYLRLLEHKSVAEIEELIASDAQEASNREKKAAEAKAETVEVPKVVEVISSEPVQTSAPAAASAVAPAPSKLITVKYEITGTEEQLSALEVYLSANNLKWMDWDV